jgi:hypothetical protein
MRLNGLCQLKNATTSSGIEPATFRHDKHINFHDDQFGHSSNIKVISQHFERLCWYNQWEGFMNMLLKWPQVA